MPTLDTIKDTLHTQLPDLRETYGVDELGVFGSYVRGEQTDASDLDVLVSFIKTPTLLQLVALKHHLEDTLGIDVDVVMRETLKNIIAPYILREVQYV